MRSFNSSGGMTRVKWTLIQELRLLISLELPLIFTLAAASRP